MCPHFALAAAMLELLRCTPDITIRLHDLRRDLVGEVEFSSRIISISPTVTVPVFRSTLAHELIHLRRGPALLGHEDHEERVVDEETASLLVPPTVLPPVLDTADAHRIARELGVDLATARLGIDLAMRERKEVA